MVSRANKINLRKFAFVIFFTTLILVTFVLLSCWENSETKGRPASRRDNNFILPNGPLRVHPSNSRYFTDQSGRAIYITGSHTWLTLQDRSLSEPSPPFDYEAYLAFMESYNHNFMRMWAWEEAWGISEIGKRFHDPNIYQKVGAPSGAEYRPQFDLGRFNQAYFDRMRTRVIAARDRGIYVSIMLFQGWSIEKKEGLRNPWIGHPFNLTNNINGIDGDPDGDGDGTEVHTLLIPEVLELQEAYVRKVIDTVNDLDNIMYEISNESPTTPENTLWQYHFIELIHRYEAKKAKQHPVLMTWTFPPAQDNHKLFASPAEAISPGWGGFWKGNADDYRYDPPAADGSKVIISDTDHLWGIGGNHQWAWKSFLRGLNPIFMDPYLDERFRDHPSKVDWEISRKNLGYTLSFSLKMDLSSMTPKNELSSTTYCLADPGNAYLIFLPADHQRRLYWFYWFGLNQWIGVITKFCGWNETAIVDLSASSKSFRVEWFNPRTGKSSDGASIYGGGKSSFTSPFVGDAVLYIYKR